jgi:hypothetical protein
MNCLLLLYLQHGRRLELEFDFRLLWLIVEQSPQHPALKASQFDGHPAALLLAEINTDQTAHRHRRKHVCRHRVVGVQQVVVKRLTSLFLIFVFALSNFYVAFWGRVSDDLLDGCAEVFGALGENTDVARETALACILRTQIFYLQVDDFLLPIQKLLLAVSSELSSRHHRILTGTRF